MKTDRPKLTILLDEGAPVQAAEPFRHRGHSVFLHQDKLTPGAPDETVVVTAIAHAAILVAVDRDMQGFAKRFGAPMQNEKYSRLDLLFLGCRPHHYAARLDQAMDFIELEWAFRQAKPTRRLWVNVEDHRLITYR